MAGEITLPRCRSLTGAHRFEARFDSFMPEGFKAGRFEGSAAGAAMIYERLRTNNYVHDICTKCGVVVKRSAQ
jgi:hypothetical protein